MNVGRYHGFKCSTRRGIFGISTVFSVEHAAVGEFASERFCEEMHRDERAKNFVRGWNIFQKA